MACISFNVSAPTNYMYQPCRRPPQSLAAQFSFVNFSSNFQLGSFNFESLIVGSRDTSRFESSRFCTSVFNSFSSDNGVSEERITVLVIGGGGREHALCHALKRSPSCDAVFCAPGNAGISNSGDATCISDLDISDSAAVFSFCRNWGVGLVVVSPEAPLVAGLANDLVKAGIPTFGPSSEAAALEGSKTFMKNLCDKYGIPTAKYQTFMDATAAKLYIEEQGAPIVVKADGLAAGKGVIVAMTIDEAYEAVDSILVKSDFGSAGLRIVVEEFLEGEEVSFFALVDGENVIPLESAQDHKRVGDGDTGPNTGGMGAYSPAPILTKELQSLVMKSIILPTVKGMSEEGCKFIGVLYAGLMIEKKSGLPKLIEYNVRFGDPECQVLMVRLESDLAQVLLAACRGELDGVSLNWSPGSAMVVVMASNGYPGNYEKGTIIQKLEEAEHVAPCVKVFHAGTALDADGNFIATGGRVLGVTAKGNSLEEARDRAYRAVDEINWPVLEVGDGVFEVLSTSGDTHLGGDDFDKRIVDWLAQSFKNDEGIDLLKDKQALQRLTETAEKAKMELSSLTQTNISLPFITATADGPKHIETTLTRAKFEELCSDLLDRLKTPVENSLRDAKLSIKDIDEVILVGGSTRIPAVQGVVKSLTGKEPNVTVNPDEVVALEAAVQAGVLAGDVSDIVLMSRHFLLGWKLLVVL